MSKATFLTAKWEHLLIMNFEIDPAYLAAYVPHGVVLDLWEGKCIVSLVGFHFSNVKCFNIPVPFYSDFDEVNLRFYVKEPNPDGSFKRGVVFIKELVPDQPIAKLANTLFHEHYEAVPLYNHNEEFSSSIEVSYSWEKNGRSHTMQAKTDGSYSDLEMNSEEEFTLEHYWGYTRVSECKTYRYEVKHPKWKVSTIKQYGLDWNPRLAYGEEWKFLRNIKPTKVMLAKGSDVSVYRKQRIC